MALATILLGLPFSIDLTVDVKDQKSHGFAQPVPVYFLK